MVSRRAGSGLTDIDRHPYFVVQSSSTQEDQPHEYGLDPTRQLLVLLGGDGVMLLVGLTACALPLRRALSTDPTEALRAEG